MNTSASPRPRISQGPKLAASTAYFNRKFPQRLKSIRVSDITSQNRKERFLTLQEARFNAVWQGIVKATNQLSY